MPQLEKTLNYDLVNLEKKINTGIITQCPLTFKRGRWETTIDDVRTILIVYEQHANPVYEKPGDPPQWMKEDWDDDYKPSWFNIYAREYHKPQPHYTLSITMAVKGDEIRLCAMTSGSGQDHLFIPDSGAEYGLFEALDITLNNLDNIFI